MSRQKNSSAVITVRVSNSERLRLQQLAEQRNSNVAAVLREAIAHELDTQDQIDRLAQLELRLDRRLVELMRAHFSASLVGLKGIERDKAQQAAANTIK